MKFVVDEMPYWVDDCPFYLDGGCIQQHGDLCCYMNPWHKDVKDRGECPCLISFEEVQHEQRTKA